MAKIFDLGLDKNRLTFSASVKEQSELDEMFVKKDKTGSGGQIICRMGDPDLLCCKVLKKEGKDGGLFVINDKNNTLYTAVAYDDLTYSIALGFFGQLTANARYGADVFENMELPDD